VVSPNVTAATVRVFGDGELRQFLRSELERLPRLKLIASTGSRNASIDVKAAEERGIRVTATGYRSTPTIEMTWALILASARQIVREGHSVRSGGWQTSVGRELEGRVLGVLGLGNVGGQVARIGRAFGMTIIAWSQNMTPAIAEAAGATLVTKDELFRQADVVTVHLILSRRTRGLIGAAELALMKTTAWLVNTSRGAIVEENALVQALVSRAIAGAALDVFDVEPLPATIVSAPWTMCWPRRISATSRKISTASSTVIPPRQSARGSTRLMKNSER